RHMDREQIYINPFKTPSTINFIKAFSLRKTWPSVTFFTAFSVLLYYIDKHLIKIRVASTILTVIGTVIGFVVSYRTSSAYERYNEGRKLWSTITITSRTMAKLVWIHCPYVIRIPTDVEPLTEEEELRGLIEKKTTINLILAFSVALKHYLRGEHGIYYEDLYHLVCFIPKYAAKSIKPKNGSEDGSINAQNSQSLPKNMNLLSQIQIPNSNLGVAIQIDDNQNNTLSEEPKSKNRSRLSTNSKSSSYLGSALEPAQEILPAYNPPKNPWYSSIIFYSLFKSIFKAAKNATGRRSKKSYERIHEDNVPLDIICCLDSYVATLKKRKVLDVPTTNSFMATTLSLTDSMTSLDRILTTPIPFGYIVHLKVVIWGYLFFLPMQLLGTFGYLTIIAVFLVSFAFLGFLAVGEEIENPFGYDANDLDMDRFCHSVIARDLDEIISLPPPDPETFYHTHYNFPLYSSKIATSSLNFIKSKTKPEEFQLLL
ncbi:Bestrophin, RFP-TM, chloride channel-domain-containing protein, partial [Phakopsora pachyrhizi]